MTATHETTLPVGDMEIVDRFSVKIASQEQLDDLWAAAKATPGIVTTQIEAPYHYDETPRLAPILFVLVGVGVIVVGKFVMNYMEHVNAAW